MNYPKEKLKNKRLLITGSSGFLGMRLFHQLKLICKEIHQYKNDIRQIATFRKSYDIICHLAALNKLPAGSNSDLFFDVNVGGTLSVMQYCLRSGARCIFASSSAVYGTLKNKRALKEDARLKPISSYGVSKMMAEDICKYYTEKFGLCVIALRIFNMYGPGQKYPFLVPDIIRQISKNQSITLEAPESVRDFIHVEDVVSAFVLACGFKHKGFLALNVGTGYGLSVCSIARKVALYKKINLEIKIKNINSLRDYVIADISNTSKVLNWNPRVSIDNGLKSTLESYFL